jgi:hypothetical protein
MDFGNPRRIYYVQRFHQISVQTKFFLSFCVANGRHLNLQNSFTVSHQKPSDRRKLFFYLLNELVILINLQKNLRETNSVCYYISDSTLFMFSLNTNSLSYQMHFLSLKTTNEEFKIEFFFRNSLVSQSKTISNSSEKNYKRHSSPNASSPKSIKF